MNIVLLFLSVILSGCPARRTVIPCPSVRPEKDSIILSGKNPLVTQELYFSSGISSCVKEIRSHGRTSANILTLVINIQNVTDKAVTMRVHLLHKDTKQSVVQLSSLTIPGSRLATQYKSPPGDYSVELNSFIEDPAYSSNFSDTGMKLQLSLAATGRNDSLPGKLVIRSIELKCEKFR